MLAWIPLPVFPPSAILQQWLQQQSGLHQNCQSWPKVFQQSFLPVFYPKGTYFRSYFWKGPDYLSDFLRYTKKTLLGWFLKNN